MLAALEAGTQWGMEPLNPARISVLVMEKAGKAQLAKYLGPRNEHWFLSAVLYALQIKIIPEYT